MWLKLTDGALVNLNVAPSIWNADGAVRVACVGTIYEGKSKRMREAVLECIAETIPCKGSMEVVRMSHIIVAARHSLQSRMGKNRWKNFRARSSASRKK